MKKRLKFFLSYAFPSLLIIIIFSFFLTSTNYRYFNPFERAIHVHKNDPSELKSSIRKVSRKLRSTSPENGDIRSMLNFVLGYLHFLKRDYFKAEKILERNLSRDSLLSDYTLFYLARIAALYNQFNRTIERLDRIDFKGSTLKSEITELYGLSYYELGFFDKAADYYRTLVEEYPQTKSHTLEILLILANIYRNLNDFSQENKILKEIILNYPTNSITPHLRKRFKQQNYSIYSNKNDFMEFKRSLMKEANGYYNARDFLSAIGLYRKYLTFYPNDENKLVVLNRLKYCYRLNDMDDAFSSVLEEIATLAPDEGSLYALGINYFSNEKYEKAADIFSKLIINFPSSFKIHRYLFNLARINEVNSEFERAEHYYQKVIFEATRNSTLDEKNYAAKSIFKIGWLYFKQKKHYQAILHFEKYLDHYLSENIRIRMLYWIARYYEHLGLSAHASERYRKILAEDTISYYGLKALENLKSTIPSIHLRNDCPTFQYKTRTLFLRPGQRKRIRKVEFFIYYDLIEFASKELRLLGKNFRDQEFLYYIASLKHQVGNTLGSIQILNMITKDSFNKIPRCGLRLLWPKKYWSFVSKSSADAGIDPYFALSIIRQESAFNPEAISVANARGLMQILPHVAEKNAKRLGIASYDLFVPKDNIQIATDYLSQVLSEYPHKAFAIAAYNAGGTPVTRWIHNISAEMMEEFIEEIPYDETHYYVKNVLRNYVNYRRLYAGSGDFSTETNLAFVNSTAEKSERLRKAKDPEYDRKRIKQD